MADDILDPAWEPMFMFGFITGKPQWRSCDGCGMSVHVGSLDTHKCPPDKAAEHQIATFETEFYGWLKTPQGRFCEYMADRIGKPITHYLEAS